MATLTVGSVAGAMFSNLEAAVIAAVPGDTIILQGGEVRLEAPGATADGRVRIDESLTIIGQGATVSRLVSVADSRSPLLADAVFAAISVEGGAQVAFANFTLDGKGHMLSAGVSVSAASATFSHVTITDIHAVSTGVPLGTGIVVRDGHLQVTESKFFDLEEGGIAANGASIVSVASASFLGSGEAQVEGLGSPDHGIRMQGGCLTVASSSFGEYTATDASLVRQDVVESAAAISARDAAVTVASSTFKDNFTGILADNSSVALGPGNVFASLAADFAGARDPSGLYLTDSVVSGTGTITGSGSSILLNGVPVGENIDGGPVGDRILSGGGDDRIDAAGGNDYLEGNSGNDQLLGGGGDDVLVGGDGRDRIEGGSGRDVLFGDADDDQLLGGLSDDVVFGGSGADLLLGEDGSDLLLGDAGADRLEGGTGHDQIYGGEGDDIIVGGSGNDALNGGLGNDLFLFMPGFGQDEIFGFAPGLQSDDRIMLSGFGLISFADVQARAVDVAGSVVLTLDPASTITLFGVSIAHLAADDFLLA